MTPTWTTRGKVLVFVNLVLALGMGAWAFGLYSGRIDWSNKPAKGSEPPGELAKRQAKLKELDNALTTAEARQRAGAASLRLYEQRRPRLAEFAAQEFAHLQSGITDQKPLIIVNIQNGEIVVQPNDGLPNMVPPPNTWKGRPFQSLATYEQLQKQHQTDLLASIDEYQKLVEEDVKLTERIVGEKGLRQLLFNEVDVKQARIKQEVEDLTPLYINVLVESELLLKRQKALRARLEELGQAGIRTTQR
jgi:hypothetical protein